MNPRSKLVIVILLIITPVLLGLFRFRGPLAEMTGRWTAHRLLYTVADDVNDVNAVEDLDSLTTFVAGTSDEVSIADDGNGGVTIGIVDPLAVAKGGTGSATASGARTNLGLAIGTDVQAYDADLTTWAGITPGAAWQDILDGTITTLSNGRTIRDQLGRAYVNVVTDYGADNTGNTAANSEIQAALDAAAAGTVVLPEGTYLLQDALELTSAHNGIVIDGAGSGAKLVRDATAGTYPYGLYLHGGSGDMVSGVTIRNIKLVGDSATDDGIYAVYSEHLHIEDVNVSDFDASGKYGVYITTDSWVNEWQNLKVRYCYKGIFIGQRCNQNIFRAVDIWNTQEETFQTYKNSGLVIEGEVAWGNQGAGDYHAIIRSSGVKFDKLRTDGQSKPIFIDGNNDADEYDDFVVTCTFNEPRFTPDSSNPPAYAVQVDRAKDVWIINPWAAHPTGNYTTALVRCDADANGVAVLGGALIDDDDTALPTFSKHASAVNICDLSQMEAGILAGLSVWEMRNAGDIELRLNTRGGSNDDSKITAYENNVYRGYFGWDGGDNAWYWKSELGDIILDPNGTLKIVDDATNAPLNVIERSAAPTSPDANDIYLDDGTNTASGNPGWRRYTGAGWEDVSAASGGGDVNDTAYNATTWDGVTDESPSMNAVRDKFESLGGGGFDSTTIDNPTWSDGNDLTLTWTWDVNGTTDPVVIVSDGVVDVNVGELQNNGSPVMTKATYDSGEDSYVDGRDLAFSSDWNGEINAPSMNVVYDRLHLFDATDDGQVDGNDAAYGADWNGDVNAPSKNAVYDKIAAINDHASVTVTDSNTVDLTLSTQDVQADVLYQDTATILLSEDASGLKADANTAAVADGATTLATGDQIRDYVVGLGYITADPNSHDAMTLDPNAAAIFPLSGQALDVNLAGPADNRSDALSTSAQIKSYVEGLGYITADPNSHDAVTVTQSSSVTLTLTGQDIQADVNETYTDTLYLAKDLTGVDLLKASGDTVDANTAAIVEDDAKHLATNEQIYDFVVGLGYITADPNSHDAVTLSEELNFLLTLTGQALDFNDATANYVLAGPTTGGAAKPTLRALVAADIPDISATYQTVLTNSTGLAGALSDETGTGAAVFGTNPTLAGATMTGTIDAGGADDLELPNGANPTVDTAGQVAVDTNDNAIRFYGDAAYALPALQTKSFVVMSPDADTHDLSLWRSPYAITIRAVHVLAKGGTSVVGHITEQDGNGANDAGVDGATDITASTGTSTDDDGTLSNPSIDAGDYVGWRTTTVNGSVTQLTVTIDYTVDLVD